jgi:hypothetical protein
LLGLGTVTSLILTGGSTNVWFPMIKHDIKMATSGPGKRR